MLLRLNDKDFVKAYMDLAKYVIPTMKAFEVNNVTEDNVPAWIDNCNEEQLKKALTKQIQVCFLLTELETLNTELYKIGIGAVH